jgi:hypothetical protein
MAPCTREAFFAELESWYGRECLVRLCTRDVDGTFIATIGTADLTSGKVFVQVDETNRLSFELREADSFVFSDYSDVSDDPAMRGDLIAGYEAVLEASIIDRLLIQFALKMED